MISSLVVRNSISCFLFKYSTSNYFDVHDVFFHSESDGWVSCDDLNHVRDMALGHGDNLCGRSDQEMITAVTERVVGKVTAFGTVAHFAEFQNCDE